MPAPLSDLLVQTQQRLVEYYRLSRIPSVGPFVRLAATHARERLWVHQREDELELALELPGPSPVPSVGVVDVRDRGQLDWHCQVVEGVSHFILLVDRAQRERPTTELELELQAELDKYLLFAIAPMAPLRRLERGAMRRRLFHNPRFGHPAGTVRGDRYRLAHRLAWRLTRRFERRYLHDGRHADLRAELGHLYRSGQTGKLSIAQVS